MASVLTAPSPEATLASSTDPVSGTEESSVSTATHAGHAVPAKREIRMGRAAAMGAGMSWPMILIIGLFHVGALAALFFFSWQRLLVAVVLYVLAINVGVGMCYHRLLTHRGYQVPKWLEYAMTVCATLSLEGGPIFWVSTHRVHHQHSDQDGDPHTPREGGWWAHAGWIIFGESLHAQTQALARYSPDLGRDRFHVWLSKYHWLPVSISGVLAARRWLDLGRMGERHRDGPLGRVAARYAGTARYMAGQLGNPLRGAAAVLRLAMIPATAGG